jgi:hypothetical protein
MKYVIVACIETLERDERVEFELLVLTAESPTNFTVKALPEFTQCTVSGEWTQHTAGGGINTSAWRLNPQYLLTVKKQTTDLHLFLTQTSDKLTHIALYCIRTGTHFTTTTIGSMSALLSFFIPFHSLMCAYVCRLHSVTKDFVLRTRAIAYQRYTFF